MGKLSVGFSFVLSEEKNELFPHVVSYCSDIPEGEMKKI